MKQLLVLSTANNILDSCSYAVTLSNNSPINLYVASYTCDKFTLRKSKSFRPKREKEEQCDRKGDAHLRERGKGEGTSDECERALMTKIDECMCLC